MQKKLPILVVFSILGLSACSQGTDIERAVVGGAAGCLVGDIVQEGECLTGAILGAGAGALADDFNNF